MCLELPGSPLWLPELGSLAGFKVTEKRNGVHVSSRGGFTYPIQALRLDPNAIFGDHERCLHFALTQGAAEQNLLGGYGSHILFCALIPQHYWWRGSAERRCLHGDLTVALSCLTCGEGELEPVIIPWPRHRPSEPDTSLQIDPLGWLKELPVVNR